jgi:hypothetical protein
VVPGAAPAPKVSTMIWIFLGVALGVAMGTGRLREIGVLFDSLIITLVEYVGVMLQSGVDVLTRAAPFTGPLEVLAVVLMVVSPGILVALLVVLVKAGEMGRRLVSAGLVIAAVLSFTVLPLPGAVALLIAALVIAATARLLVGPALIMPLVTLATLTAYRYTVLMIDADDPVLTEAGSRLAAFIPGLDPVLAELILAVLAIAPFVAAAAALLRETEKS